MTRRAARITTIVTVVCLIGLAAVYCFWFWLPMGHGPAGPQVPNDVFGKTWTDREVLFLGIGDSITAGYGAERGRGYFNRVAQNPEDEWPDLRGVCLKTVLPHLRILNVSVSGSTSLEHLERQVKRLVMQPTNIFGLVVMTTGGNDIIHNYGRGTPHEGAMFGATFEQAQPWIAAFDRRLEEMIGRSKDAFPGGCQIFLANIYDPTDGTGAAGVVHLPDWPDALRVLAAYNTVIARCAERHVGVVHLVDIHGAFLGHGLTCRQFWRPYYRAADPHYWYFGNLEDPNDRGYDVLRRLFLLEIARAMMNYTSPQNPQHRKP
jgi:lysophospholipase L1-like esterase